MQPSTLKTYSAKIIVKTEYIGPFDNPNFSSHVEYNLSASLDIEKTKCIFQKTATHNMLQISNIQAASEDNACLQASNIATKLLMAVSYDVQSTNPNPHYGQIKFSYDNKDIIITPKDNFVSGSVSITNKSSPNLSKTAEIFKAISENSDFEFLLSSYYAALSPTDFKSKFFNSFLIIEFIEIKYRDKIVTTPLIQENDFKKIATSIEGIENFCRIKSRLHNELLNATMESRAEKLTSILNDYFKITELQGSTIRGKIDLDFSKSIIKLRNGLFHAGSIKDTEEELKNIGDRLIYLNETILNKLLFEKFD